MNQPGLGAGAGVWNERGVSWEWVNAAKLDGLRWRWDGFWPGGVQVPRDPGTGGDFGGLCLPPKSSMRRLGKREIGVEVVGVVGAGCGVVRVCGVKGEKNGGGGGGRMGKGGGRRGDEGWKAGGWKREVEDRWVAVVGLLAWEAERWGGCCVAGE